MKSHHVLLVGALALPGLVGGCALGAGAAGAGAAYEYQTKQQLEELEKQFQAGEISREEYLERKKAIEEGSVVY